MPYITREDGERFVIPSYRDVLAVKQKSALKKEILLLSQSYGEYITLQRKAPNQYEVAFSPDTGYLLGESIWQYFKRPLDMIYCEEIPNTTEAILVIVKEGSVYLDGSFPLESIPEELIIFLTQQNNFEIYIYGDVPISEKPEEGKFSFEPSSVKSFSKLSEPVFSKLPLLKMYQLQPVDVVLRENGIGVFPYRQIILVVIVIALGWFLWSYLHPKKVIVPQAIPTTSPYLDYYTTLTSPAPDELIKSFIKRLIEFQAIPGWTPVTATLVNTTINALMQSSGSSVEILLDWAKNNATTITIRTDGIYLSKDIQARTRPQPKDIYPINEVMATLIDKLATVYPGNHLSLSNLTKKDVYSTAKITITFQDISFVVLSLISDTLKDLPLALQGMQVTFANGNITGTITLEALGS